MSFILYTGEIVSALILSDHPRGEDFENRLRSLNDEAARALAAHLSIDTVPDRGPIEDGNFAAVFGPAFKGQALPEALKGFDTDSEWGEG